MIETAVAMLLCNLLNGGETEVRHKFDNLGGTRAVRVDCETPTHVIEIGLDGKASARDSIHQAVFAQQLTGKRPMVILIDRDGVEDRYEQELRIVTSALNIPFGVCKERFIQAWAASAGLRNAAAHKMVHDLPPLDVARRHCDLSHEFGTPDFEADLSALGSDKPDLFDEPPKLLSAKK